MLEPKTLHDLNKAFEAQPEGFVVVDGGRPSFAVLDYQTYQNLSRRKGSEKKKEKILVTGGAGYIGSITVRLLQKHGYEVVVFDNLSTGLADRLKNARLIVGDLADRELLEEVFAEEKFDAVIHFAASIEVEESVQNPAKYFQNNVVNGLNLLDVMVKHGVNKIVFSSSAAVYGEASESPITEGCACLPANPYGETKLIFEQILNSYGEAYGLNSVSLRYFNAAGAWPEEGLGFRPGMGTHLIPRVLDVAAGRRPEVEVYGQDYETTDGTGVRDYVHVRDLAQAHVCALEKLDRVEGAFVFNVGTGKGHSVLEVIEAAMEITGRMIPIAQLPRRAGDPAKLVADSAILQRETSWQPDHDLHSIIESAWQWRHDR